MHPNHEEKEIRKSCDAVVVDPIVGPAACFWLTTKVGFLCPSS